MSSNYYFYLFISGLVILSYISRAHKRQTTNDLDIKVRFRYKSHITSFTLALEININLIEVVIGIINQKNDQVLVMFL